MISVDSDNTPIMKFVTTTITACEMMVTVYGETAITACGDTGLRMINAYGDTLVKISMIGVVTESADTIRRLTILE